jgi:hypothetical protein
MDSKYGTVLKFLLNNVSFSTVINLDVTSVRFMEKLGEVSFRSVRVFASIQMCLVSHVILK